MNIFKGIFDVILAPVNIIKNTILKGISGKITTQVINYLAATAVAFIAEPHVAPILQQAGITIDPVQLTIGIGALVEAFRKYLKEKFNLPLG